MGASFACRIFASPTYTLSPRSSPALKENSLPAGIGFSSDIDTTSPQNGKAYIYIYTIYIRPSKENSKQWMQLQITQQMPVARQVPRQINRVSSNRNHQ